MRSDVFSASKIGDLREIKKLIYLGHDLNVKDQFDYTPLIYAASNGYIDCVEFLVEYGLSVHDKILDGRTAIHFAAENGENKVISFLLEQGVDINIKSLENDTPINLAAFNGRMETVKFLLESGAKSSKAIYWAMEGGHKDIAEFVDLYLRSTHENNVLEELISIDDHFKTIGF